MLVTIGASQNGIELGMSCVVPELSALETSQPDAARAFRGLIGQKVIELESINDEVSMKFKLGRCADEPNQTSLDELATFIDGMAIAGVQDKSMPRLSLGTHRREGITIAAHILQPRAPLEQVAPMAEVAMNLVGAELHCDPIAKVQLRPQRIRLYVDKENKKGCNAKAIAPGEIMSFHSSRLSRAQQLVALAGLVVVAHADTLVTS